MPIRYRSSLRTRTIEETLELARPIARDVGLVRITDTTPLDRIGVPVFAAIRPAAEDRSLCVSAGKGLTLAEARAGAIMEGIELAFAEASRAGVRVFPGVVADVVDGHMRPEAIADLAPDEDAALTPDTVLDCAEATDLRTGQAVIVPAEKVIFPYVKHRFARRPYFSSDGNGIASGNSLEEATLHGLTEIVERDVASFHNLRDRSQLVYAAQLVGTVKAHTTVTGAPLADHLPDELAALAARLDGLGFDLCQRNQTNDYGMPTMKAILRELGDVSWGVQFGWGTHLDRSIAAVRAVTEAIQHRLSMIHGGRDDIHRSIAARARISPQDRGRWIARHVAAAASEEHGVVSFDDVADLSSVTDIPAAIALVLAKLAENGLPSALRVELGPRDLPLAFVRILVPGAELYGHGITNLGPRLRRYARAHLAPGAAPPDPSLETTK